MTIFRFMLPRRWWWDAAEVSVFEAVAIALEGDDFGVVDEAVDHGGGDHVVAEDLAPAAEGLVAGDDPSRMPAPSATSSSLTTTTNTAISASGYTPPPPSTTAPLTKSKPTAPRSSTPPTQPTPSASATAPPHTGHP